MWGTRLSGIAHVADFYSTFSKLAGLSPDDPSKSAPAPLDSIDQWQYWSGSRNTAPRNEIVYDHRNHVTYPKILTNESQGALRVGDMKLIVGTEKQASWYGQFSPNTSTKPSIAFSTCSVQSPCLFNLSAGAILCTYIYTRMPVSNTCHALLAPVDPTEHVDLMAEPRRPPAVQVAFDSIMKRWKELDDEFHPPRNPQVTQQDKSGFCKHVDSIGFIGPWASSE
jgi:hypothetical protein